MTDTNNVTPGAPDDQGNPPDVASLLTALLLRQRTQMITTEELEAEGALAERFWSKVDKSAPDSCWRWKGTVTQRGGYGHFWYCGKYWRAHRVAYEITNGGILNDLHVLHRCDNRVCCNPSPLFLGTNADNVADRNRKGRQAKGERLAAIMRVVGARKAKLTELQVREIRSRCHTTTRIALSIEYGVSRSTISFIALGKRWRHL